MKLKVIHLQHLLPYECKLELLTDEIAIGPYPVRCSELMKYNEYSVLYINRVDKNLVVVSVKED